MPKGRLKVFRAVSGDEQESCYANSCQTLLGELSVSIAIEPILPEGFGQSASAEDRKRVADYLKSKLSGLCDEGFNVTVLVGKNED